MAVEPDQFLRTGSWPAFSQLAKPSRIQLLSEITSNYYGHLAQRTASFFHSEVALLAYSNCGGIRDRKLSYILNATSGNSSLEFMCGSSFRRPSRHGVISSY